MAQWKAVRGSDKLTRRVICIRCSDGFIGVKELPEYLEIRDTKVRGYTGKVPADVIIPEGVTAIGHGVFKGCTSLASVTIPSSVTYIGRNSFSGCTALASLTVPSSVMNIDEYAFYGCTSLKEIQFKGTMAQWKAIKGSDGVKVSCVRCSDGNIGIADVPAYLVMDGTKVKGYTGKVPANLVIPDGVTAIGGNAFKRCFDIVSVTIPGSVKKIYDGFSDDTILLGAFSDCTYLERVTILDGLLKIPDAIFYNCTSLASVTIPNSVTSIGAGAFCKCASLTAVTIPDSVTEVGGDAFMGCSSLKNVSIPKSVKTIGNRAFSGCTSLRSVSIFGNVTYIAAFTFFECKSLVSVTIPDSVTSIGMGSFASCTSLKSVTIPRGVTQIDGYAFTGCTSLTNVSIPRSVTQIGSDAFIGCSPNLKIQYDGTKAQWNTIDNHSYQKATVQCTDGDIVLK